MARVMTSARTVHHFFLDHHLYPLILASALAAGLYVGRVLMSRQVTFLFLSWNLFLAWIPYVCSLWIVSFQRRFPQHGWMLILPSLAWLIFLPNAPYLITDLWHLDERPPIPLWYDIGMLATFAWTGCFLAFASLSAMQSVVARIFGGVGSWLFVLTAIGLSGMGIYLGRFLRWNSWDLILQPQSVVADALARFAHPLRYPQALGATLVFGAFLLVGYLTFASVARQRMADSE